MRSSLPVSNGCSILIVVSSLADLQRAPGAPEPERPATLPLAVERVRTFDTPEFAGMRFLEVEVKSALNRVSGMPFPWSINPYRGCSHACSYCLSGETPILMADGRTKPIAEVQVGEAIVGTVRQGAYRRYAVTRVLDHWSAVKPAYRVRLEDGTELITSGDHRFLTDRGWKHVRGSEQGRSRRPHLTLNNRLIGTGGFAASPKRSEDYRHGYLCGMIRGDAHLGSYEYERAGRSHGDVHRLRLALADDEALQRTSRYLAEVGVWTRELVFAPGSAHRRAMSAIRTQTRAGVERIAEVIAWPPAPTDDWCKGFLAGIFDAEGGYSRGILRISNNDGAILEQITSCLRRFGFSSVIEAPLDHCKVVRVRGGLREHLRFFHLTDPAITRKRTIEGQALKSGAPLDVVAIEPLGISLPMFDITTGTGDFIADGVVSHNCFARPTHAYLNLSPLDDFERTVVVKTNLVEVLRRELARPSWRGEHVAMGTNTDPYQRCEGRYRLMPGVIETLAQARTPFSILTKGTLITRDVESLVAAAEQVPVSAALSIGAIDPGVWRDSEPGTPSPAARLSAVRTLNDAGIPTGVMLAPILPGLSDGREQLAALVDAAVRAGAVQLTPIVLHLRPGVREVFWPWLTERHPELVGRYTALYRRANAAKAYRDEIATFVAERRAAAWKRHGRPAARPEWRGRAAVAGAASPDPPAQLSLL
ncbi:MAG: radical SAM protein [Nitriliruptorales bacterium]|nr:radical SAM protein [Nitriliruptorales bacterium]